MAPKKDKNEKEYGEKTEPWEPVHLKPVSSDTITIETDACTLVVWSKHTIPGTQLHPATCHTGACVVISKPKNDAGKIYELLSRYDHPNLLKPIGIWEDPNKVGNAYLAFEEVHGCVKQKREEIFSMDGTSIYGFSDSGFKIFRGIFSAVNYVNNHYKKDAESTSSDTTHPLYAMNLVDSTIFYRISAANELQAVLGDFHISNPAALRNLQTRSGKPRDPTHEDIEKYNWNSTGDYLSGFYKKDDANEEMKHLAMFLKGQTVKEVMYDELLWEPGLWEADLKMEYIREIWWHVDRQRDKNKTMKLKDTDNGKLLSAKPPLGIIDCILKLLEAKHDKIVENTLMDSVEHLRDHIVAHQDLSYLAYQGPKDDVGVTKAIIERYVQKTKGDYMITLIRQIRPLGWIAQSPLVKDKGSYMDCFYQLKRVENLKQED
uniref:Uncharacterized protein n=1 Tax=Avena sativa TaxID=4498 RepID=A0ACD5UYU2_AVESA